MTRKYHNRKITIDGITFDSQKEASRWQELKLLERAGEVTDLKRQVKYTLIPAQYEKVWNQEKNRFEKGKLLEREIAYIADFVYKNRLGLEVVEDVKGFKTPEYRIKRKLLLWELGIRIFEV